MCWLAGLVEEGEQKKTNPPMAAAWTCPFVRSRSVPLLPGRCARCLGVRHHHLCFGTLVTRARVQSPEGEREGPAKTAAEETGTSDDSFPFGLF